MSNVQDQVKVTDAFYFLQRDSHNRIGDIVRKYGYFLKVCQFSFSKHYLLTNSY